MNTIFFITTTIHTGDITIFGTDTVHGKDFGMVEIKEEGVGGA